MRTLETDVLIVGAGPAGLTAAALLARQGVPAIAVTKYAGTANGPRAHITNQRTLEVMRDLGIESRVYAEGQIMDSVPDIVWVTTLAGREIVRRPAFGAGTARKGDYEESSPCHMVNIAQNLLEPVLLRRTIELGADVRFSTELTLITQDEDGVTATVQYRPDGHEYRIRAKYVIGADGGRSTVATQLGFRFDDELRLGYACNAYIEADLEHLVAHRPATLYFTNKPGREYFFGSGTFALVRKWNEWLAQISYDPEKDNLESDEKAVLARIHGAIGDSSVPVRIKNLGKWELRRQLAREYRKGRVFLAGDSAHRHIPANGLGQNTSIQDSYNLSWKLAAVLRGEAGEELLDTYEQERLPVGRQIVDRATASAAFVAALPTKIGIFAGQSEEEGWQAIDEYFAPTPAGASRRAGVRDAVDEWHYGTFTHGVEMGQRYTSGAVVSDGTPFPVHLQDSELYYEATTHPGAYLPHAWLERSGKRISTLDLAPGDTWTLITGVNGRGWVDASIELSSELGFEIAHAVVGPGQENADVYGDWARRNQISDGGAVLVRPDKYVAWRAGDVVADPVGSLRQAFVHIGLAAERAATS